jgi:hypothetical protein
MKEVMRVGLRRPASILEMSELTELLAGVHTTLTVYSPDVYASDLESWPASNWSSNSMRSHPMQLALLS